MAQQTTRNPRGIRNNNPLNIRKGNNWQGERHPQTDPEFEEFSSMLNGLRAGFIILRKYLTRRPKGYGCNCIQDIIERWAPPTENNTLAYIQRVCAKSMLTAREPIKWGEKNKLCRIVWGMCLVECGQEVSFGMIENAYALACG